MEIICENCGEENEYGRKFCQNCGHKLFYYTENSEDNELENKEIDRDDTFWENFNSVIVTTTSTVDGYIVDKYIDIVSVEKISGLGIETGLKSLKDVFSNFTGSEMRALTDRITELKEEVIKELKEKAVELGGNAVIGIDIENSNISNSGMMITASGTVVKISKK